VQISIKQCRSSGIDTKVHGLTIIAKKKSDEDQIACGFSFLALDEQPEQLTCTVSPRKTHRSRKESRDGKVQVYVWGLNDKDQLGGQKGSKVSFDMAFRAHAWTDYLIAKPSNLLFQCFFISNERLKIMNPNLLCRLKPQYYQKH
jgi:hypothetical protein